MKNLSLYEEKSDYIKEIVKAYNQLLEHKKLESISNLRNEKNIHSDNILKKLNKIKNERTKFLISKRLKIKENDFKKIEQKEVNVIDLKQKEKNMTLFYFEEWFSYKKNAKKEFIPRLIHKLKKQDSWFKQISRLPLSKLIMSIVLNSWREKIDSKIILHVRKSHIYFKSESVKNFLQKVISNDIGKPIELLMTEDNDSKNKTPFELYKILYNKELIHVKEEIKKSKTISILKKYFNVKISKDDISLI